MWQVGSWLLRWDNRLGAHRHRSPSLTILLPLIVVVACSPRVESVLNPTTTDAAVHDTEVENDDDSREINGSDAAGPVDTLDAGKETAAQIDTDVETADANSLTDGGFSDDTIPDAPDVDQSGADAAVETLPKDAGTADAPCLQFEDKGYCFNGVAYCHVDAECPSGKCGTGGKCDPAGLCDCVGLTCGPGVWCYTNNDVCGMCLAKPNSCKKSSECGAKSYCTTGGYCQKLCCQ